jgi:nicotinate phosphoribosyltransferase
VRLDSGDLGDLAVRARSILDDAELPEVRIIASGGLDEYAVDDLVASGAPIDTYAVGTRVGVSADAPYLDSAYKLVEFAGRPVMKLSSAKVTAPGRKQVFRRPGCADEIALADEVPPVDGVPLLETVMRNGRRSRGRPTLEECRERLAADLGELPPAARRIRAPVAPRATASERLGVLTARVRQRIEDRMPAAHARQAAERAPSGSHRSVPR